MGMGGGAWIGAAGADVSASTTSKGGLRLALDKDPGGGETLRILPRWGQDVAIGGGVAANLDSPIGLRGGVSGSIGMVRKGEFTFHHVLPGEQSTDPWEQYVAGYLVSDALSRPFAGPPALGVLVNALHDAMQGRVAAPYLTSRESRAEVQGTMLAGAGADFGFASVKVLDPVTQGVFALFSKSSAPFSSTLAGYELAGAANVAALQTALNAADPRLGQFNAVLSPHAGPTGIVSMALQEGSGGPKLHASYAADSGGAYAPFSYTSGLDTREIVMDPQPLRDLTAYDPQLVDALAGVINLRNETNFRQAYASTAADLIRWSADHPGTTAGEMNAKYELARGTQGQVTISVPLVGWPGVETSVPWSAFKGREYELGSGVFRDGGVVVTETHTASTVPAEDSRTTGDMIGAIMNAAIGAAADYVSNWFHRMWSTITSGVDKVFDWADGKAHAVFHWAVGAQGVHTAQATDLSVGIADYEPSVVGVGTSQVVRTYQWSGATQQKGVSTQEVGPGLTSVVSAGPVRWVALKDDVGNPITVWPTGLTVTLRIAVTAADLQARGVDTNLLRQVQICRWDDVGQAWYPQTTTQDAGDFVALVPEPGQYMPALTWQALDSQGPAADGITRYDPVQAAQVAFTDGATVRRLLPGAIQATISDRPAGLNFGLNPGSVVAKIDGTSVTASVTPGSSGQYAVGIAPPASLCPRRPHPHHRGGGHSRLPLDARSLALPRHRRLGRRPGRDRGRQRLDALPAGVAGRPQGLPDHRPQLRPRSRHRNGGQHGPAAGRQDRQPRRPGLHRSVAEGAEATQGRPRRPPGAPARSGDRPASAGRGGCRRPHRSRQVARGHRAGGYGRPQTRPA